MLYIFSRENKFFSNEFYHFAEQMGTLLRGSGVCRFCAEESDQRFCLYTQTLVSPGSGSGPEIASAVSDVSYSDVSSKYLGLKLDESSPFPQFSCSNCTAMIQSLLEFFHRLKIGQAKLTELLIAEGSLEMKKRGRPKKGCEKNVKLETQVIRELKSKRRRVKIPKRYEDSSVPGEDVLRDTPLKIDETKVENSLSVIENSEETPNSGDQTGESVKTEGSGIFTCEACDKVFSVSEELDEHFRENHGGDIVYRCDNRTCNTILKSKEELRDHQTALGHEDFIILEFGSDEHHSHTTSVNAKVKLKGEQSSQSLNSLLELNTHEMDCRLSEPKVFNCDEDQCDRSFSSPAGLAYHRSSAHNQGQFFCSKPGCGKLFKLKNLLRRHEKTHSSERSYNCDKCNKSFKTNSNLKSHLTVHDADSKFFCDECGQQFKHRTSLAAHIRWHQGEKSFKCPYCTKSFSQKGNLQEHIRIHTGDRPFRCDLCPRTFTTSSQHRLHVKRHLGVKHFKCDICAKSFLNKDTLKTHLRRHKGEKPFACQICKKAFAEAWALTKHMRFHSGETPYLCKECGKKFADSSNLAKHRKTHEQSGVKSKQQTVWSIVKDAGEEMRDIAEVEAAAESVATEEVEQVIYITYENSEAKPGPGLAQVEAGAVRFVEITEAEQVQVAEAETGQTINLTTKDGTQYRIVTPFNDETLNLASEYIKEIQD